MIKFKLLISSLQFKIDSFLQNITGLSIYNILILEIQSMLFGFLFTMTFAPFNWKVECLVPLFLFYFADHYGKNYKTLLIASLSLSISSATFSSYWILNSLQMYSGLGYLSALIDLGLYSLIFFLKIPFFIFIFHLIYFGSFKIFIFLRPVLVGIVAVITELFSPELYPWAWGNLLGKHESLSQIAEFTGISGLTFILFLYAYLIYRWIFFISNNYRKIIKRPIILKRLPMLGTSIYILALLLTIYLGDKRLNKFQDIIHTAETTTVAMIQPSSPPGQQKSGKILSQKELQEIVYRTIPSLARDLVRSDIKVDLTILPESAVPYYSTDENKFTTKYNSNIYAKGFHDLVKNISSNSQSYLFYNEITRKELTQPTLKLLIKDFNSATLMSPNGEKLYTYDKNILSSGEKSMIVYFFETFGLKSILSDRIISLNRFGQGDKREVISYNSSSKSDHNKIIKFLPMICYEGIISSFSRSFTGNPDFFVNITQDGWYGNTIERFQHLELVRMRSIEYRRSVVRAANSGISVAFDPTGKQIKPINGPTQTAIDQKVVQIISIPIHREETFYKKFGLLWLYVITGFYIISSLHWNRKRFFQK